MHDLLPVLLADLPALLDDVAEALAGLDPTYPDFLVGSRDEALPLADRVVRYLVAETRACLPGPAAGLVTGGDASFDVAGGPFEELGREQWRRQLPVHRLLAAYRLAGRVGWRRIASLASDCGVSPQGLTALGEAAFRFLDELCAVTTAGYTAEQAASADGREQLRRVLAERLLSDRADRAAVTEAARAIGWPLPATAAVVLVPAGNEPARRALARMTPTCLLLSGPPLAGAIVPDADAPGARRRLVALLDGVRATVGPPVPLDQLPESARLAELAIHTLAPDTAGTGPLFVAEHLDELIVHRDLRLLAALRNDLLRPLAHLPPASREALRRTLRSWLLHMGDRRAVAQELCVHPQTVRYRLARLREVFGASLDEPASRRGLLLALGWEDEAAAARPAPEAGPVLCVTAPVDRAG